MCTATTARLIAATCLTIFFVFAASGAEFSGQLDAELKAAQPDEFVSAILMLPNAIDIRALDLELHDSKASLAERHQTVIEALKYNAGLVQPKLLDELRSAQLAGEVEGFTPYWIANLVVISARKSYLENFHPRGDIEFVTENFKAELIEPVAHQSGSRPDNETLDETTTDGQDAIGATRVNRELGITGLGVLVANLDTGVDGDHPALASRWRGNFAPASEAWLDVLGSSPNFPNDFDAHGTHVMGTITGREISGGDTTTVGCAPDAQWIACNAIGQGVGGGFDNDVINAYEWFIDPDGDPETMDDMPDVVQNSWGVADFFPGYDECDDRWNSVILNLEAAGTVVTWSAGNEGPSPSTLRTPANYSFSALQIFSVGAVSVTNPSIPSYNIASFSSRGPTPCANPEPDNIKPEISAPGVDVFSSVPGGGYESFGWSGTSMAGPHVAGVVALMRQVCPNCDPISIKEALLQTALDQGTAGEDNTYGWGVVDAYEAVTAVASLGWIVGTVTADGEPLSGVAIEAIGEDVGTMSLADGSYSLPLGEGSFELEFSKFGYITQTISNVDVIEGDSTELDIEMEQAASATLSGSVRASDFDPLPGATVAVTNADVDPVIADGNGNYSLELPLGYEFELLATSPETDAYALHTLTMTGPATHIFVMPAEVACYDFETAQGWTVGAPGDDASTGVWSRDIPEATFSNGAMVQPDADHTEAPGQQCWVTDGNSGSTAGDFDVDNGQTTLLSPVWDFTNVDDILVSIWSWYSNDEGANPGSDEFSIDVTNDGFTWVPLVNTMDNWEEWRHDYFLLGEYLELTDAVQLRIIAADEGLGSLVEAAVDDICLYAILDALSPPEQLTCILNSAGEIELRWQAVNLAEEYRIFYAYHSPVTPQTGTLVGTTSDTTFIHTGALDAERGHYYVVAVPAEPQ